MSEVKKKIESEIQNIAGTICTPLRQIYDSHVIIESNIQPLWNYNGQWVNAGKKIPAISTSAKRFKIALKESWHY